MSDLEILYRAKEFLCRDKFPGLSIQLIATDAPVAYFFPRSDLSTIVVFIKSDKSGYRVSLFQMFHEAGHFVQYMKTGSEFSDIINEPAGTERAEFEKQAWKEGAELLEEFLGLI